MVYLDTGCLLKLYYPEPESAAVVAAVASASIIFTALHGLEVATALQLNVFRGEARTEQAMAVLALIDEDLEAGKLVEEAVDWRIALRAAADMANTHAAKVGCRSLDILHCALAKMARATDFISSDARQVVLARAEGLRVLGIGSQTR